MKRPIVTRFVSSGILDETWLAISKDGAVLPALLAQTKAATLHIASGETYDFEFRPDKAVEIPLQFENPFNNSKVTSKFVVQ